MMDEERKHYCDVCGRLTDPEVLRVLGFCSACEQRLHAEADAEHAGPAFTKTKKPCCECGAVHLERGPCEKVAVRIDP